MSVSDTSGIENQYMELKYGSKLINIRIFLKPRKRLSITVHPDMQVTAKAPDIYSLDRIKKAIEKKASWIYKQLNYFEDFQPIIPERKFISGETHYYIGRQYRLRIRKGDKTQVKLIGRFFQMELPDTNDSKKAKKLMQRWYLSHAKILLTNRILKYIQFFTELGAEMPDIHFRRMKKRWGSCSADSKILLNTELVKAPLYCIDYVIIHELCHLIYPKHNHGFYLILKRIIPDWEKRKERLEKVVL